MAKIKYAAGLTALLNKHFGFVFQPNATNQTMKSDSNGARTRWTRQTQRQQGLMKAIRNWRIMSAVTKANWVTFAATYPQASRRNPAIFLSGYQLFLKRNHYCFLNHGIDCDFMEDPSLDEVFSPDLTFSLTASDNSLDVTELYISNFGILPKLGQFVLIKIYPMSETSGQFFAPIEQTIEVQEVFIDGLFVSFDLTGLNENLTFSVYLSKVCHPSIKYVGTKIRYMGCFTPKTFAALTDTPDDYTGEEGNPIVVNAAGDGLEFGSGGGGGLTCEDLAECPEIISIYETINSLRFDAALFVCEGYCDDGINWVEGINSQVVPWGCACNASMFIIVGQSVPYIKYSYDGKTWIEAPEQPFSSRGCSVAWNGSMWLAAGYGTNTLAYSYDGLHWTGLGMVFSTYGYCVTWNGSIWLALGKSFYEIYSSTDGINWTPNNYSIFSSYGTCAAWNGTMWVAGGSGSVNTMAYSYDGINWTGLGKTIFSTFCWGIAWNGTRWVAGGYGSVNSIAYSYDGINWTGLGKTIFSTYGSRPSWNGKIWVICGFGTNNFAYSYDGINWIGQNNNELSNNNRAIATRPAPCLYPPIK